MDDAPHGIPIGDLEIAQRIADGARSGRPGDRSATLEQLLAAFGERAATPEARDRAAAALAVAGVSTEPDLRTAAPGTRLHLSIDVPTRRGAGRALIGALALVLLLLAAAAAALLLGGGDDERVADLPASTSTSITRPTATVTTPPATTSTKVGTTTTTERRTRKPRKRKRRRPAAPRTVRVQLAPSRPTYLCIVDGDGERVFGGTLSAPMAFRAPVLRLNVGLGPTTVMTVGRRVVPLSGSPAGVELRPGGKVTVLEEGDRPEC